MPDRGQLELTWLGHSTSLISAGGTTFLTDPVLRNRIAHLRRHSRLPDLSSRPEPDAVLISHHHLDHLDLPSLKLLGSGMRVIGPTGTGRALSRAGFREVEEISEGQTIKVGEAAVRAVRAEHQGRRSPFHPESEAIGFVIDAGRPIYFAGDTDLFEGMEDEVGPVDLALLPVWGWGPAVGPGHLDPERAARATAALRPEIAVPIHWGTFFPVGLKRFAGHHLVVPPHEYQRLASAYAPDTEVRVLEPGSKLSVP
jgi:L-ascorbate metabolism protein UlaG (beta-lactamase superfamily)